MGRFNFGGLVTSGTGRFNSALGGMVLLKNGVFRSFETPSNPQTTDQMNVRATFAINTQAWQGLTEAQRLGWQAAAASGTWTKRDPFTGTSRAISSGKLLYMYVNQNIVAAGGTAVAAVPTQVVSGTTVATAATAAAGAGTFTITYTGALVTNERHLFTATPTVGAGQMQIRRAIARFIVQNTTASPATIAAAYVTQFGALTGTAGRKIFISVEAVNSVTGQRRPVGIVSAIIAA